VQILRAVASHEPCELSKLEIAFGTASRILWIGSLWPITPVDMTRELLEAGVGWSLLTASAILAASSRPRLPVTALAHPELMIMDRMPSPFPLKRTSLLTVTGAAWNLFLVKTAAAEHGVSDAMSARSGKRVLDGLTPTWVAETRNPLGYVPDVGTYFSFVSGIEPSTGAE